MKALLDAGFHVRRRWVDIFEDSIHIRRLDQIFFISDAQVVKSQRFCSDFVIEMDATFNTNILKMPLATVVGVDNHNRSFTAALSFIRSEAAEDYGFILNCLDQLVFYGADTPRPQVLISDQSSGLRKAILSSETWSSVYHQLCGWHMVQNLKAFIQRNRRYLQSEDLHDIWTAIWDMVQSHPDELHKNKTKLFQCLYPEEVRYYQDNWEGEKEYRVLEAYACKYPNLGLRSTSRNEGQNSIIKTFLDHKMNLEQATRELIRTLSDQNVHDESLNAQSSMKRHQPGTVGMNGLRDVETILTMYAINLLRPEMHAAQQLELQNIPIVVLARTPSECPQLCKNSIEYGLPCQHIIQPFIAQRRSLPRSLIHPRWFINPTDADSSHPSFRDAEEEHYLTQAGEILLATEIFNTEQFQVQLPSDQAEQFATRFQGLVSDLRTEFQTPSNSAVTTFVPPPKKNKHAEELKRRAHGRAMARLPTSAELAEIEVRKRKRAMSAIVHSALPSTAPARLQFSGRSTKRVVTGHSSSEEICKEQSFQSVTQDLELPWIGSGSGIASETQNTSIDLCELDTQEGIWIDNYASGRVGGIVMGEGTQMQDRAEGSNEESQLSWHDGLDTQATVLL